MKTVILDTNFLLIPHQFRINILAELEKLVESAHEFVIGEPVMAELRGLAKSRGKKGIAARVALAGIEKHGMRIIPSPIPRADDWVAEYCKENPGVIVCTNDIELRRRLKGLGNRTRLIVMRTRTKIFWA
jgi:rRNA-processing protein FCF1